MGAVPTDRAAPATVVVVGAGLAGAAAVAALRAEGFDGAVTVLGAEGVPPYDRPPLSKELLARREPVWLAEDLGLTLVADDVHLATPATGLAVAPDAVVVRTGDGDVAADAAVLATGAHAVVPRDWTGVRTLHTAADAATLRPLLVPGARLVVIGAGWIGAEVAGVAASAGVAVTVVEAGPAPLAAALGPAVGALTAGWYATAGVRLVTGTPVVEAHAGGVRLAGGEEVAADVVLAAVGARPTSAWLGDALALAPDGAVEVGPDHLVPGLGHVAVVGDLARRRSPRHGPVPGGHWDGALRGPVVAARALLGRPVTGPEHDLAPYVFSTQLGHELGLHGQPGAQDDVVLRGDPAGAFGAVWFVPGTERATAVLAVDRPRDVAAARRVFTAAELPRLDRAVAADPDRPLKAALLR